MGMRCIAVFVDADADAPFVQEADEAVRLPSTYLDADAVLAAARASGLFAPLAYEGEYSPDANASRSRL